MVTSLRTRGHTGAITAVFVDWSEDPGAITRRVRALSPEPAASTTFRDRVLKVFRAEAAEAVAAGGPAGPPGAVVPAPKHEFLVAAGGGGAVNLLEVAPEGRKRMSGAEFVRGYRPQPGEVLGARAG